MVLLQGLIIGVLFGFLLQKGQVLSYGKQVGAMLLKDFTIFKFMLSAIVVASICLTFLNELGAITLTYESFSIFGVVVGGLIFGLGWGLLGYCPGTAGGALATGSIDAGVGMVGMLFGSIFYAFIYPFASSMYNETVIGSFNLHSLLGPFLSIIVFTIFVIAFFRFIEKKGL